MRKTIRLATCNFCFLILIFANICLASAPLSQIKTTDTFEEFYERFTSAVNSDDWDQIIELTRFPFIVKGQLDMEGEIKISEKEFKKAFPALLDKEAFIDVDGELIQTTYRGLLMTRMENTESINPDTAQIHNFEFNRIDGSWVFVHIYADPRELQGH